MELLELHAGTYGACGDITLMVNLVHRRIYVQPQFLLTVNYLKSYATMTDPSQVKWMHSLSNYVKLNVNAAFHGDVRVGAIAAVI